MSFSHLSYIPYAIIIAVVFIMINVYVNRKYFNWIKLYWNYQRTNINKTASILYYVSFILLVVSLLDLRGPEERIETSIPDQKTIIILDSSASMLAEDIKPNRFSKAIQLARHFVKNSPGHQIAVVLFSDVQKRLIPFTDDLDLLDSRLAALSKDNAVKGGSNIAQAIKEAVGYFKTQGTNTSSGGNILVFTDAEESDGGFSLSLGSEVNLAVVGIGTAQGGRIPLRWDDGSFRGYKTYKGEEILTKLDEAYIKNIGKNVESYQFWIANSYSLPTLEINSFFREKFKQSNNKGDIRVKPVLGYVIVFPAILLFCVSIVLSRFKTFKTLMVWILISFSVGTQGVAAKENDKKEKEVSLKLMPELYKLKAGKLKRIDTLKLAEAFLRDDDLVRANELYKENIVEEDEVEAYFNMATGLLAAGKLKEAMKVGRHVFESNATEKIKDQLRSNFLLAQQSQDNKDNQDKNDKQDKGEESPKQDESGESESKSEGDDSKEPSEDKKDGKSNDKEKDKPNKSDEPKEESEDLERPERENEKAKTIEEKEKEIEQQRKLIKTPAMIKQILNDDRELQKKLMDTSTNEKGSSKGKRDW